MIQSDLFSKYLLGTIELNNRIVMAPMTRSRALERNAPNDLMVQYYRQRAEAGLIITEGTAPSPNGLGYARIPGIYSFEQIERWKDVTKGVHDKGGVIFLQIMHTGRVSHPLNMPEGARVLAPSPIRISGKMFTDQQGMLEYPEPLEMTLSDIEQTKKEFVLAAQNAIEAGFDGIELHGANGYLLEQFLHPAANQRSDQYGGTIANRARFVIEVAEEVTKAIGWDRVGIRISPYGVANDLPLYPEIEEAYTYLVEELNKVAIAYIHVVDHHSMGAPEVPVKIKQKIGALFNGTLILSGGYDLQKAQAELNQETADLIAFGRPFISNPDLVYRFKHNIPLNNDLKTDLFYSGGEKGYTDYPLAQQQEAS